MKKMFFSTLTDLARSDSRVQFIKSDTAYVPDFQREFPNQYLDVGIAEQNMIGIAAGMALEGLHPFTYSIVNFAVMRCLEQIRNDIAYHRLPVTVVSCGAGFDYGALGHTHHATEDLALMRSMPEMTVFSPCDPWETQAVTLAAFSMDGPSFIRNGHGGEPRLHTGPLDNFKVGKAYALREGGGDVVFFTTGSIAYQALLAADELERDGIDAGVWSFPTVKPIDRELILEKAGTARLVVTLEEHSVIGGLGGAVAEVMSERPEGAALMRLGVPDAFAGVVGSPGYLRRFYGLDGPSVAAAVRDHKVIR